MSEYILVIDDEEEILEVIKTLLEGKTDVIIETVSRPEEAVEKIHQQKYKAIVTDIKMPTRTGLDIVHEVRWSDSPNIEVPILIFTAFKSEFDTLLTFRGKDIFFFDKSDGPNNLIDKILGLV